MAESKEKAKTTTERPDRVVNKMIRSNNSRARKDINQWRTALQQAENVDSPKRILLYNLYDEILLDAHLTAEIDKRIQAVAGSEFELFDENGAPNTEASNLLRKKWFTELIESAMWSKFWGHSLVEITQLDSEGKIAGTEIVPRRHVIPERGIFTVKQGDEKGTLYREDQSVVPWLFEFGKKDDLGLLNKCAPHVLFKRFAQSAWSEFCELFGMPVRVGRTQTKDTNSLNKMEDLLLGMATASYAVIDKDEEIEFIETAKSDGGVYKGLIDLSSAELSKVVNGSVIGEASQGGSRSKEEVGLQIQEKANVSDKKWLEGIINEVILPRLETFGYPVAGLRFEFEKTKDTKAQWAIVEGVLNYFEVDENYIVETFGIPVTGKRETPMAKAPTTKAHTDFFE